VRALRYLRRHLRGSTLKFTAYALVCLVLLGGLAARIGNLHFFTHRVGYEADMTDVSGLNPGDDVKLAGVTVGQVGSITTRHGLAVVDFSVDPGVRLPVDTQVGIRWHNVLGQRYLYLYPSGSGGAYLRPGATIPPSRDAGDADIGEFLNALGPVLQSIDPAQANAFVQGVLGGLQGNLDQVGALIDNAATVSDTVGSLQVQLGRVIDNLTIVVGALGGRSQDLEQVVTNLATISSALASRNDTLDAVVENFSKVSGEFASLVGSNRSNLDTIIASLQTISATLASHKGDLDQDLSTLTAGLQPYTLISSLGQWFDVNTVYVCHGQETAQNCSYQEGGPKPSTTSAPAAGSGGLSGLMSGYLGGGS
jgi:phospholipid/cholesterol/gamma-HCH transport system substrate-binding protein